MAVRYNFERSNLKNNKGFVAKVHEVEIVNREKLLDIMAGKGTNYTKPTLIGALSLIEETIIQCLQQGKSVNINNFLKFGVSIKGVYPRGENTKEIDKKQVKTHVSISKSFNKKFQHNLKLERVVKSKRKPIITSVVDGASNTVNKLLTFNRVIRIEGKELSFDPKMEDEGLFLENQKRGQTIKLPFQDVVKDDTFVLVLHSTPWAMNEEVFLILRKRYDGGTIREEKVGPFLLNLSDENQEYNFVK